MVDQPSLDGIETCTAIVANVRGICRVEQRRLSIETPEHFPDPTLACLRVVLGIPAAVGQVDVHCISRIIDLAPIAEIVVDFLVSKISGAEIIEALREQVDIPMQALYQSLLVGDLRGLSLFAICCHHQVINRENDCIRRILQLVAHLQPRIPTGKQRRLINQ